MKGWDALTSAYVELQILCAQWERIVGGYWVWYGPHLLNGSRSKSCW